MLSDNRAKDFSIIGIGTSAGGLETLKEFFDNVPEDYPHAFVVIQHLSPDYKSLMVELLSKSAKLPVKEIVADMPIERRHIYFIPPNKNVILTEELKLQLTNRAVGLHEINLPINIFFKSLADYLGENAIGIVLSGTGSDGTLGAKSIKEAGGLVVAQDPREAKFDGMPKSVIATGLVDFVLPIAKMPEALNNYIFNNANPEINQINTESSAYSKVISLLKEQHKIDFNYYKKPTITRRLVRRMNICGVTSLADYYNILKSNIDESLTLYREFLIGVTKFYRDNQAWQFVEQLAIKKLVEDAKNGDTIKVWDIACSTGEETYSLAISFDKEIKRQKKKITLKIFATDIDKQALDNASRGSYPDSILSELNPEIKKQYFVAKGEQFAVVPEVRSMIIFSYHNIITDPPLNKMDMVVCRNLLIYFQPLVQKQVMSVMHYSLKLGSFLWLGTSETISGMNDFFEEVHRSTRLYKNIKITRFLGNLYSNNNPLKGIAEQISQEVNPVSKKPNIEFKIESIVNETLTDSFNLSCVLTNENFEIINEIGDARRYLKLPSKGFTTNLIKMLPRNVGLTLKNTLKREILQNKKDSYLLQNQKLKEEDNILLFDLLIKPVIIEGISLKQNYLFVFKELTSYTVNFKETEEPIEIKSASIIGELEDELKQTKESLNATIQEVELSNEELQTTNEELLAANEELQSTNEELQSVNEELHTVNSELQQKILDLQTANEDIDNLINSTAIGTIFLDDELCIRKFTPAIKRMFNLVDNDIGRPIDNFSVIFGDSQSIINDCGKILKNNIDQIEREITTKQEESFLIRILPFTNIKKRVKGVVIALIDITNLKQAQLKKDLYEHYYLNVMNAAPDAFVVIDADGKIINTNQNTFEVFGRTNDKLLGRQINIILPNLTKKVINESNVNTTSSIENMIGLKPTGETFPVRIRMSEFSFDGSTQFLLNIQDITEFSQSQELIAEKSKQLQNLNKELEHFTIVVAHDFKAPLANLKALTELLNLEIDTSEESKEIIVKINESVKVLENKILALKSIVAAKNSIKVIREKINLHQLVNEIEKEIAQLFSNDTYRLTFDVDYSDEFYFSVNQLKSILFNLITNAIKYRKPDVAAEVKVCICINKQNYIISVSDNGLGIDLEANKDKLFKLFGRIHKSIDGSGMGLYLVKTIVEAYQGKINLESEPGKGTIFSIDIPRLDEN